MLTGKAKIITILLIIVGVLGILGYAAFAAGTDSDPGSSGDPLVTRSYVDKYVQWNVADLKAGQVLTGHAGTEIIVRRGKASVVDPTGNGIPDITDGQDILSGNTVPLNHLLVIPRDDNRGIKASVPVVVMYRGGGTIQ